LKIRLDSGETETLLTNLNQKQLPIREAGALYFKRWGVETGCDALKSKLQMENFSGKSKIAVEQDFYATVFLLNMASAHASILTTSTSLRISGAEYKRRRKT
jgi:IS4 transposase